MSVDGEENPFQTPVDVAELVQASEAEEDATGGVIPYKNPAALTGYYLGIFSFLPLIGFFLAVPALILGIHGLRAKRRQPQIRGSVHAWIGIVMGGFFTLVWGGLFATVIVSYFVAAVN